MEWVRLGDVALKITKGTTPTSVGFDFVDKGINFIKIESISEDGVLIPTNFAHISEECNNKLKRSQLEENDILFSIAGAIGRVAVVKRDVLPANTNQALAIIRVPDNIDCSFLACALRSPALFAQCERQKQGVAQINLSLKNISDFLIPRLSLDEQRRIAAVLDKVSDLIAKRRQQLEKLDELVKARFVEMFGGHNFPLVKIRDVVAPNVASSKKMFTSTDTIKYIDISSVDNIRNRVTNFTEYVLKDAPSRAQQCVREGDILVSTVRPNLRNVAMIESRGANFVASSGFCVLRAEKCSPFYLLAVVCSDEFTKAMSRAVTGANYPAIKNSDVLNYETALPPLGQQERFSVFGEQVEKVRVAAFRGLEQLEMLKKALIQSYFKKGD